MSVVEYPAGGSGDIAAWAAVAAKTIAPAAANATTERLFKSLENIAFSFEGSFRPTRFLASEA